MANSSSQNPIDTQAIERADQGFRTFMRFSTYAIIGVIGVLSLMAIFLL